MPSAQATEWGGTELSPSHLSPRAVSCIHRTRSAQGSSGCVAVSLSSSRSEPPSASSRTRLCRANRNSSCEIGQRNWPAEEYAWTELRDGRGEKVAPQPQLGDLQHAEESDQVRVLLQADAELRLLDDLRAVQHISRSIQTGPQFKHPTPFKCQPLALERRGQAG